MTTHVEWTDASRLSVAHIAQSQLPEVWVGDDPTSDDKVLVLEDAGNCLAFVIHGTPDELLTLAAQISDLAGPS